MDWYTVTYSVSDFGKVPLPIPGQVVDATGRPVQGDEYPVAVHEVRKGVDVRSIDTVFLKVNPRIPLGDCLAYRYRTKLILSDSALAVIHDAGCVLHPEVYLLPLVVRNPVLRTERGRFKVVWQRELQKVLDIQRSDIDYGVTGKGILGVNRWVLREDFSPEYDLLQCESYDWLCSQRFVDSVRASALRGFAFKAIAASST